VSQCVKLQLPQDFAAKIADTLNWKLFQVTDTFEIEEGKDGYFYARLKPKKWLDKPDFKMLCTLVKDLGGDAYLEGAKCWRVPSAYVKKGPTGPQQKPSGHGIDSQGTYREPGNALPATPSSGATLNIKFIQVDAVQLPTFLPTRAFISSERLSAIRQSIKKHGLKYPIKVRPGPDPNSYELIDGYLRLKSVQQLDWKEVPAEITPASDQQVVIDSIITNKDRIEEDPITIAKKLDILVNAFGWTQEKLAEELGIDRTSISHHIRLLQLPEEVQHCVALHNVSFYHAVLLLQIEDPKLQVELANEVVSKALSTRQLEERVREVQPPPEVLKTPEKHKEAPAEPAATQICAHCGEPIEGTPINLGDGNLYDAECAEQVAAASKQGLIHESRVGSFDDALRKALHQPAIEPETPSGPTEPEHPEKNLLKAVPIGEFDCTECGKHFLIEHMPNGEHKLRFVREAEG
jgi:ParB family chromosome partitioning protein